MMKYYVLFVLFFAINLNSRSQELTALWSDCIDLDGEEKGIYEGVVASSETRFYALYTIHDSRGNGYFHHYYTLRAFDKSSMKIVKELQLTKKEDNNYKGLDQNPFKFHKIVHIDGRIVFFHSIFFDDKAELHALILDEDLNVIKRTTKILESPNSNFATIQSPKFFVAANHETSSILAGCEVGGNYKDPASIEYKILDSDLVAKHSNKTAFPYTIYKYPSCNYSLQNEETIFIQFEVRENISDEETKKKDSEYINYHLFHVLSAKTGEFVNFPLYFEKKEVSDFLISTENGICEVTGLFKDLTSDPTGIKNHGVFKIYLDLINTTVSEPTFNYFTEVEINEIYRQDNLVPPMRDKKILGIPEGLIIEDYAEMPNGDWVLFCTRLHNYSFRNEDINDFYSLHDCDKVDVTCMRINAEGEVQWLRTFPRRYTIKSPHATDISGIYDEASNSLICTFGSGKAQVYHKTDDEDVRATVDYLLIDADDGQHSTKQLELNSATASKADKKYILPRRIFSLDGALYFHYYAKENGEPMPMVTSSLEGYEAMGCMVKFYVR